MYLKKKLCSYSLLRMFTYGLIILVFGYVFGSENRQCEVPTVIDDDMIIIDTDLKKPIVPGGESFLHGKKLVVTCWSESSEIFEPAYRTLTCRNATWTTEGDWWNAGTVGDGSFPKCRLAKCDCKHGGMCVRDHTCDCPKYTKGLQCETPQCPDSCKNGGSCAGPKRCECAENFFGQVCEFVYCKGSLNTSYGVSDKKYYGSGEKIKCAPDFEPATESVCQDGRWSQEPRCVATFCDPPKGPEYAHKQQYKNGEHFECATGYELQGDSMCNMGQWSQPPRCVNAKFRYRIRFKLPDNMRAEDDPDHRLSLELVGKNGHHANTLQLQIDFRRTLNEANKYVTDIGIIDHIEVAGISRVPDFISISNADRNEYYMFRPVQEGSIINDRSITLYAEGGKCSFTAHKMYPYWIRGTYDYVNAGSTTDCNILCLENRSCAWTTFTIYHVCYRLKSNSRRKEHNGSTMFHKICEMGTSYK